MESALQRTRGCVQAIGPTLSCLLYLQTSSPLKLWDIYILEDEVVGHDHGKKPALNIHGSHFSSIQDRSWLAVGHTQTNHLCYLSSPE